MKLVVLIAFVFLISSPLLTVQKTNTTKKVTVPLLPKEELPEEFFWNDVNGTSYLTIMRNHHFPQYCGGCYAFATSSTLSDKIKIARKAAWPDINISPQVILSCTDNHGCHGGSMSTTFEYIKSYGITDETCSAYIAMGHENGAPCTDEIKCSVCNSAGECKVPESYPVYYVEEYGRIHGELAMMNEISKNGPISCMLFADYIDEYDRGVAEFFQDKWKFDHIVEVIGYGTDVNGFPYWLVRNSWGYFWGEDGFFRVGRGNNSLGLESSCYWVKPKDTWTNNIRNHTNTTQQTNSNLEADFLVQAPVETEHESCVKLDPKFDGFVSLSGVTPFDDVSLDDIPKNWDWRNASGKNFLSWTRNQNNPNHCDSCWADAATSALADRIMISRNSTFPHVGLSSQVIINCKAGGDCSGGDPLAVYEFASEHGIPEDSCQPYLGKERENATCSGEFVCLNCQPPAPRNASSPDVHNCLVVENFRVWKVSDYGRISGAELMKKAIYSGGPIVCTMQITPEFEKYQKGIFSQSDDEVDITAPYHAVSIVGWYKSKKTNIEHWIVRNSWGTYWGEHGYFRINAGEKNLGIENNCYWATPIVSDFRVSRFDFEDSTWF